MFKVMIFLKRRPGMSMAAFCDYYETRHSKLGEKYSGGGMRRYMRRYITPLPNAVTGELEELDFDVVTECWFEDRDASIAAGKANAARPEIAEEIIADEMKVFDRSK